MKTKITLLFLILVAFSSSIWAQPVITALNGPVSGTKTHGYIIPGAITPGTSGANQTWDYSGIVYNPSTYYLKTVDYAGLSASIKALFPTGNAANEYVLNGTLVSTLVFKLEAADFLYLGFNTTVFAVPDTQLVFPHNYLETHAGFTYDAYGTLKTPFGNFNNVVRLREISGSKYKYDYWQFSPIYKLLMEYLVDTATQAVSGQTFYNTEAPVSINEFTNNNGIKIFPNPVNDKFFLELPDFANASADIYNMNGQLLQSICLQSKITILNTDKYPKGIYFIKIQKKGKVYSEKIVIN